MAWIRMSGGTSIPKRYIYYKGNEMTSATGGWSGNGYSVGGHSSDGTIVKRANDIYSAQATSYASMLGVINPLDLRNHSTIKVHFTNVTANAGVGLHLLMGSSKTSLNYVNGNASGSSSDYTITFDISNWRIQNAYVALSVSTSSYTNGTIDSVELI